MKRIPPSLWLIALALIVSSLARQDAPVPAAHVRLFPGAAARVRNHEQALPGSAAFRPAP
jgi:hypothetical protein